MALEGLEYKNRPEVPDVTFQVRPGIMTCQVSAI